MKGVSTLSSKILMLRCVTIDIALKLANMKVMFLDFFII